MSEHLNKSDEGLVAAEELFRERNFQAAAFKYDQINAPAPEQEALIALRKGFIECVQGDKQKGLEAIAGLTEATAVNGVPHPSQWSILILALLSNNLIQPAIEALQKYPQLINEVQMQRVVWGLAALTNAQLGQTDDFEKLNSTEGMTLLPGESPLNFFEFISLACFALNAAGFKQEISLLTNKALLLKHQIRSDIPVERLGTEYGGWNIQANALSPESIVYCAGVGEDISFDLAVLEKYGCDVHAFDPTPKSKAYVEKEAASIEKFRFHDIGLWEGDSQLTFFEPENPDHVSHSVHDLQKTSKAGFKATVKRLKKIMSELGHEKIDLLKMDIEGAEYPVVKTILEDKLSISTLCIEYHNLPKRPDQRLQSLLSLLEGGFDLIAIEYDNYSFAQKGS